MSSGPLTKYANNNTIFIKLNYFDSKFKTKPVERKVMRTSFGNSLLVLCLIFVLHEILAKAEPNGEFIMVPPFNISQKDLLQHLKLGGHIKFDVPALYTFSDSVVDAGNNIYYNAIARANYTSYGIDFDGGKATYRFTNGQTEADFIGNFIINN